MEKVYVKYDENIPQFACTHCSQCTSIMGTSLCSIKNRGCCWYFPKFELFDIQRMSKTIDGIQTLHAIRKNPGTVVYHYYIHAKGYFDQEAYGEHIRSGKLTCYDTVSDYTIFFRACPFVKQGYGCTLPPKYRTYVCNFFICSDILENPSVKDKFQPYIEERSRYVRWLQRENIGLEHILREAGVDLVSDFDGCVDILRDIPINYYEFPELPPVYLSDAWNKGA